MLIPVLFIAVQVAAARPAPMPPPQTLASPTVFIPQLAVVRPSLATQALLSPAIAALPASARTGRAQCGVYYMGAIGGCARLNGAPYAELSQLTQAVVGGNDLAVAPALLRLIRTYRLSPISPAATSPMRSIILDLSVLGGAPGDSAASKGKLEQVAFAPDGVGGMPEDYPPAAIRAGAEATVTADCRVMADHSLFCANAHVVRPDGAPAEQTDILFEDATRRTFARSRVVARTDAGIDTVGHDVTKTIHWRLPR